MSVGKEIVGEIKTYPVKRLTLGLVDCHRECEPDRKLQALETEGEP